MKKTAALLSAILISTTLTACYQRGTGTNYENRNRTNTGTTQGTRTGYNTNQGTTIGNYKDGTYTAYGDPTSTGNHMATVFVKGGRISNVVLDYTDTSGKVTTNTGSRPIVGSGNASGGNFPANNYNMSNPNGSATPSTGTTTGMTTGGNTSYNGTGTTGYGTSTSGTGTTNMGNTTSYGNRTGTGNPVSIGNSSAAQYGGITGNTTMGNTNGAQPGYSDGRDTLANLMVQNQTYDVNPQGLTSQAVANWKLAAKRALSQARR